MRLAKEESIGRFRCANLSVVFVARSVTGLLPWLPSAVQFTRAVPLHCSLFTLHCLLPSAVQFTNNCSSSLFTLHFSLSSTGHCLAGSGWRWQRQGRGVRRVWPDATDSRRIRRVRDLFA